MENLTEKIRVLAKEQGKTIARVERDCKIANGSIRKWQGKTYPSSLGLYLVAGYLNTTMDDLMRGCVDESDS